MEITTTQNKYKMSLNSNIYKIKKNDFYDFYIPLVPDFAAQAKTKKKSNNLYLPWNLIAQVKIKK
jgi:hypothetical protein